MHIYSAHLSIDVHSSLELKKKIYNAFTLLFLFFILSCFHSPFSVSLSSLPLHLFFFPPQTHKPFSLPHRPITDLHKPSHHKPIAADPRSTVNLTHFGLSSLFSAFWLCVSGYACVLALYFGLGFCFEHGFQFLFQAWVSIFVSGWVCVRVVIFLLSFFILLHWFWWARRDSGCAVIFMGLMVVVVVVVCQ